MGKPKLFIGLPVHDTVNPQFFMSVTKMAAHYAGSDVMVYPHVGDSLINRARNAISRYFLQSDCTHLLMIDSDLIFSNAQIEAILKLDKDIVGGTYFKQNQESACIVCNTLPPPKQFDETGNLMKVKYVGTGFICIKRCVFERMIEKYAEDMKYFCDHDDKTVEMDFWRSAPYKFPDGHIRYLSEDWWFCQRARDCGFEVWLALNIILGHCGLVEYPLKHQAEALGISKHGPAQPKPVVENCAGDAALPTPHSALSFSRGMHPAAE
jgi:hypothetical protein